jgi:hypothetical protein
MPVLISAELLRLRTVRSPRYGALGVLALLAVIAAMPIIDQGAGAPGSPSELADSLRATALLAGLSLTADEGPWPEVRERAEARGWWAR